MPEESTLVHWLVKGLGMLRYGHFIILVFDPARSLFPFLSDSLSMDYKECLSFRIASLHADDSSMERRHNDILYANSRLTSVILFDVTT